MRPGLPTTPKPAVAVERRRSGLRRVRRMLLISGGVLVLFIIVIVTAAAWFVRRAWPQVSGTIAVPGLRAPVQIVRDTWGIPHIYAETLHDLFFSQGYVHAQDRMWQLEFTRRFGNGRLSEVLGSDAVSMDSYTRVLGFRRSSEMDWKRMGAEDKAVLEAYAEGVNAYLDGNRDRLSVEFTIFAVKPEDWSPIDTLVLTKLESWVLSENASIEMTRARVVGKAGDDAARKLLPPYSDGAPVIVPPGSDGYEWLTQDLYDDWKSFRKRLGSVGASNSWVISGSRTASGRPILANDTHLELFLPSVWYANGLHGGGIDVVGYSLAGTPAVSIGHNGRIAWGITDLVADVQDLYIEKLDDSDDPQRYEHRGEWRPLEVEVEEIGVKDENLLTLKVARTVHGPLVSDRLNPFKDSRPMSMAWASEESPTIFESLIMLNRAGNWDEFRHALSLWDGPNVSFVYADVEGNIGYQAAGRIPDRAPAHQGIVPVPGWTGEFDWKGYIPFDELPRSFNPPAGFIVTANQKATSDDRRRLGYEYADPFRAIRITQMLAGNNHARVEDSQHIQGDTYHIPAGKLRPYLLSIAPADDLETRALAEVRSWNLRCDPEEIGAAIYQVWYRFLVEETVNDELGSGLTTDYVEYYWVHGPAMLKLMDEPDSPLFDDSRTEEVEARDDIVRRSFAKALGWLTGRYGSDLRNWKWGRLHTVRFMHRPFGMVDVPIVSALFNYGPVIAPGGDRFTVNATWFTWDDTENPFAADAGTSQRIVIDLSEWDNSIGTNSTGQSEQLFHPHREDLIRVWRDLKYHALPFSRKAVEAESRSLLTLVPVSN